MNLLQNAFERQSAGSEVVGQRVSCPYCGHPVPILHHQSIKVTVTRFSIAPTGEFHERTQCRVCRRVFCTSWSTSHTRDLFDWLKEQFR